MLKSIANGKLQSNCLIIEDKAETTGSDIFTALLTCFNQHQLDRKTHLICLENPPEFYLSYVKNSSSIIVQDIFSNPCGWNGDSGCNIISFPDDCDSLSESVVFIDSFYHLVLHDGFFSAFKKLNKLKRVAKNIVCIAHGDLLSISQLEKIAGLATVYLNIKESSNEHNQNLTEKIVEIAYKKSNGKIINDTEIISIDNSFQIESKKMENKEKSSMKTGNEIYKMESLTTFRMGLQMKDNEKRAKEQLILPYLRNESKSNMGNIQYNLEPIDIEEDPDDDLDI